MAAVAIAASWLTHSGLALAADADNGEATHLITYDRHLREIRSYYPFKVCGPVDFLRDLRQVLD